MTRSIEVKDKQNKEALLIIDGGELIINYEDERKERIELEFIYGVLHKTSTLIIHVASRVTEPKGRRQETEWKVKEIEYEIMNQNDESTSFVDQLTRLCLPLRHQDTRILALINPSAGRQAAATHWESTVRPMLLAAGFKPTQLTTVLTEKNKTREQAKKCASEHDWERTVLVVMGGDGTLHEVINGLLDGDTPNSPFQVGVIPVGSGNAFSLGLGIDGVIHATLRVIKGQTKPCSWMDVRLGQSDQVSGWEDEVSSEIVSRLLVVMSWGFHAQIVSKSRYLQYFMGNSRFSLVAGLLLTFLKQYSGELVLKDAVKYDSNTKGFSTEKTDKVIKDDQFTYFIVSKQPSLEKGFEIAPFASPLNDDMDIVLLRAASSKQLTEASMKAFEGGEHVKLPFVEYYKASELLLRVKHKTELCLDGEIHDLSPNGIIHLKVVGSNEPSFVVFV